MLERLFRSNAEVSVLGTVLFKDGLFLREVARRAGVSPSEAKKELGNLVSLGVLKSERKGNLVIFSSNTACPFLNDLKSLYLKTEGVFAQLKKALSKVEGIRFAFVYGSFAKGDFTEKSDVDVLVIGMASDEAVSKALFEAQKNLGREVNFILWTEKDFLKKIREGGSFISSVMKGKKAWLAGDENEFARLAEKKAG